MLAILINHDSDKHKKVIEDKTIILCSNPSMYNRLTAMPGM
jgi:hypothetical protein